MKMYDEVTGEVYYIYAGEELPRLHDTLTEEKSNWKEILD